MDGAQVDPAAASILFASSAERPAPYSLVRALAAADRRGIRLHVLHVLPRQSRLAAALGPFLQNNDMQQVRTFLGAARDTARWYGSVLGPRFNEEHALVSIGDFAEEVRVQALAVRASMIVIPAGELLGAATTALACAVRVPVLVVREVDQPRSIIAATELGVDRVSILAQARELGLQLNAGVVELHNIYPSSNASVPHATSVITRESSTRTSVITRMSSHAEGILNEARTRDADTVVVGTSARSVAQPNRHSVAAQVIDGARRSVLVVPVALLP